MQSHIAFSHREKGLHQHITIRPLLVFTVGYLLSAPLGFGASMGRFYYPRFRLRFFCFAIGIPFGNPFYYREGSTRLGITPAPHDASQSPRHTPRKAPLQ